MALVDTMLTGRSRDSVGKRLARLHGVNENADDWQSFLQEIEETDKLEEESEGFRQSGKGSPGSIHSILSPFLLFPILFVLICSSGIASCELPSSWACGGSGVALARAPFVFRPPAMRDHRPP